MQTSSSVDYGYLRQLVFGLSQNVLDPSRDYLFETRLTKLLRNQGMTQLEELVQHVKLRKNPALERAIAAEILRLASRSRAEAHELREVVA